MKKMIYTLALFYLVYAQKHNQGQRTLNNSEIDDKELYRQYEKDFYKVEYALSNQNSLGLPDPVNFKVDFSEVEYPMTTQDKIMLNEYKLKHNLVTEAQLLAEENKDISVEEAEKIIEDNKEKNGSRQVQIEPEVEEDEYENSDKN